MSKSYVCGECVHFRAPEWCWRHPPTAYASGFQRRPKVNVTEPACGEFKATVVVLEDAVQKNVGAPGPEETRGIVERLKQTGVVAVDETPGPKYAPKHKKTLLKQN